MSGAIGHASLAMYAMPEFQRANESWWKGLSQAMVAEGVDGVPERLAEASNLKAHWTKPDLLFSQTCGYPLMHGLAGKVTVIATPGYDCHGCEGSNYCSFILVRENETAAGLSDLIGRSAVVNSHDSQSGFSALRAAIAPFATDGRFFSSVGVSGGHMASMAEVKAGNADVCSVDAVTYALAARYRPSATEGLRVLAFSPQAPGLPYITAGGTGKDRLQRIRAALFSAIEDPKLADTREALLIERAEVLPNKAYDRILYLENEAIALGYADVA
ncbi:phosphate/phosphite/phosphonate ABC transporter substrate-binding protein [Pelagibius sp. Alg239-R121]|uniref:phosphate/phosphite/phosphonate ABC transporter substrate-binding protein n=1 Tax=Pelagibius sp. Alg239-R121 TaxID=2993448 RepID=UPI0024A65C8E|nr:PhnD/SsuA/transferrin family substrate-binding protein [Pelagibius sp. Alg239-R121]